MMNELILKYGKNGESKKEVIDRLVKEFYKNLNDDVKVIQMVSALNKKRLLKN